MIDWQNHIITIPILLPLLAAGIMFFLQDRHYSIKAALSLVIVAIIIGADWFLMRETIGAARIYNLGDWPAPFGIVLVADRLSTIMLLLTGLLALCALFFSAARWDRAGPRFHMIFMLLLMGLNGAFLTGDLFNLFVFFEVLLAASYGLALHGYGTARVRASLHYIAINLFASSLFLIGAALVYGTLGTLNLAHIGALSATISAADRPLFEGGLAILGIAFLIKVGMWPLGFWLTPTYSAACAPVASLFAIMSKVGIYALLRLSALLADPGTDEITGFFSNWLFAGGVATLIYGSFLTLSARNLVTIACACVFISSGAALCSIAIGSPRVLSGGLYYMINSTIAIAAFFLLIELLNRFRGVNRPLLPEPVFTDEYQDPFIDGHIDESQSLVIIPAALALLSGGFLICAILLAGMPPLAGFIGKFAMMAGAVTEKGMASQTAWVFILVLTFSSLAGIIAIVRSGIEALWVPHDNPPPPVALVEFIAIALLLAACLLISIESGTTMAHMDATSAWLLDKSLYIHAVLPPDIPVGGLLP